MPDSVTPATPNNITAIKQFFEMNGGRKIDMAEFKALSPEERNELGKMCAEALTKLKS